MEFVGRESAAKHENDDPEDPFIDDADYQDPSQPKVGAKAVSGTTPKPNTVATGVQVVEAEMPERPPDPDADPMLEGLLDDGVKTMVDDFLDANSHALAGEFTNHHHNHHHRD